MTYFRFTGKRNGEVVEEFHPTTNQQEAKAFARTLISARGWEAESVRIVKIADGSQGGYWKASYLAALRTGLIAVDWLAIERAAAAVAAANPREAYRIRMQQGEELRYFYTYKPIKFSGSRKRKAVKAGEVGGSLQIVFAAED